MDIIIFKIGKLNTIIIYHNKNLENYPQEKLPIILIQKMKIWKFNYLILVLQQLKQQYQIKTIQNMIQPWVMIFFNIIQVINKILVILLVDMLIEQLTVSLNLMNKNTNQSAIMLHLTYLVIYMEEVVTMVREFMILNYYNQKMGNLVFKWHIKVKIKKLDILVIQIQMLHIGYQIIIPQEQIMKQLQINLQFQTQQTIPILIQKELVMEIQKIIIQNQMLINMQKLMKVQYLLVNFLLFKIPLQIFQILEKLAKIQMIEPIYNQNMGMDMIIVFKSIKLQTMKDQHFKIYNYTKQQNLRNQVLVDCQKYLQVNQEYKYTQEIIQVTKKELNKIKFTLKMEVYVQKLNIFQTHLTKKNFPQQLQILEKNFQVLQSINLVLFDTVIFIIKKKKKIFNTKFDYFQNLIYFYQLYLLLIFLIQLYYTLYNLQIQLIIYLFIYLNQQINDFQFYN